MSSDTDKTADFVLLRTMTPRDLVCLLLNRFPTVRDRVCPDEFHFKNPTIVYDSFAKIVREKSGDSGFIQSVALLIDELANIKEPLIQDVLNASLLEGIAENAQLARTISGIISSHSGSLLHEVERKIYGREP